MKTIILVTAIRYLTPLFLVFSIYILFRGHNHPGGGFIGGLIGSIAFVFHVLAYGSARTVNSYFQLTVYHQDRQQNNSPTQYMWDMVSANTWNRLKNRTPDWRFHIFRVRPAYLMAAGLFLATTSGVTGLLRGKPFMTGWWMEVKIPFIGSLGTPTLFDAGVYMLVMGMVLKLVFTMSKE
ncbi:MnhB domain-containing protein [Pontibacter anaerobius]|uniref:Cation:proton antiporter n=1 Tax=Pontibacter anaerobius TaxID=2993940 RepID=A0ABT3RK88_9BACT|nr:MnhB domain-containing protein [Pontibacter anaerobius]MCX2741861.1 cation:proton antiporter [Pontibacter anaerobius]